VEVDVVSNGRAGILGIGSEPARVKVTPITGDSTSARMTLGIVEKMLKLMEVDAWPTIRSSGSGPDAPVVIDIQGEDSGLIIGHRGETLRSLQFLVNVILNRLQDEPSSVVVDVEQYRDRRAQQVTGQAERMAERAMSTGHPVDMDPMSPADRRVVHIALADNKGVTTQSSGEGRDRRVTISPTGEAAPSPQPSAQKSRGSEQGGEQGNERSGERGSEQGGERTDGVDGRRQGRQGRQAPQFQPPAYPDDRE
jgi:spoIIIJ-associated protein